MQIMQVKELLRGAIAQQMRDVSDKLSAGRAGDFPHYRQMVGYIQGSADALRAVDAVFHKILDDEGDDE